ncbi:oligosaccharide flippase family protein [Auraticoccus monumenti]|uniref:oligosaccharide flippase family protein n=1 Tax=Auraticoccus monumenti TaxID=675864 RepID=UPI0012FAD1C7|nr:oligosaccharide flippase family protein [Auraticoccus monumenti]
MVGVACSLLSGIATARMLGASDRGTLAVALTVVGLLSLIGALGSNVAFRMLLPSDGRVTIAAFGRLTTKLALPNVAALLILMVVFSHRVDRQLSDPVILVCVAVLGVTMFFSNQVLDCFNALHQSHRAARLNALGALSTAILNLLCWIAGFTLTAALLCYAAGFALRTGIGLILLHRAPETRHTEEGPGGQLLMLSAGLPLMGGNLGQLVMLRLDQVLVGVLLGSSAAGIYAVASIPAGVLAVVSSAIGQVVLAEAARGLLSKGALVRLTLQASGLTLALAVTGAALAPWLLPLLFGAEFSDSTRTAQVLLFAQVALAPFLILNRAAVGYGMVRWSGLTGLAGAVTLIVTVLLLVPQFGVVGAGGAATLTFAVATTVTAVGLAVRRPWAHGSEHQRARGREESAPPATM